jgi:hypothetical protein
LITIEPISTKLDRQLFRDCHSCLSQRLICGPRSSLTHLRLFVTDHQKISSLSRSNQLLKHGEQLCAPASSCPLMKNVSALSRRDHSMDQTSGSFLFDLIQGAGVLN